MTPTSTIEKFEIEVGDDARVHSLVVYTGTRRGAVRAALKRWRAREEGETCLVLRRPNCRPIRFMEVEA